jgi:DNA-binding beta-propeller fold protein YncE
MRLTISTILVLAMITLIGTNIVVSSTASERITRATFTTCADFTSVQSSGIGIVDASSKDCKDLSGNTDAQLQLPPPPPVFDFIWIALSVRGTIVKVNTETGKILGEYLSAPDGRSRNPSRTTVDLNGNVWVVNRDESSPVDGIPKGSVVHIGLQEHKENNQCVDRNGNGVIDTSTGLGDVKLWPNPGGVDDRGGVSSAEDECIIHYVRMNGANPGFGGTVAVNLDNNVWVGGLANRKHDLIDGKTGIILKSISPDCGGYGGLVDGNGVLWSASSSIRAPNHKLLRYDPSVDHPDCLDLPGVSYGLGIDMRGNIWHTHREDNKISKISSTGTILRTIETGGAGPNGVAVTHEDNNVWVANRNSNNVTRLDNNAILIKTISVGSEPTGVAVDPAGKVWVTNLGSNSAMRINPATNQVDLTVDFGTGAGPYNYSDMTGTALRTVARSGFWTVIFDSQAADTQWRKICWTSSEPADSKIEVTVRSSNSASSLPVSTTSVSNCIDFGSLGIEGQFIQVQVKLTRNQNGDSPIVNDVEIFANEPPVVNAGPDKTVHVKSKGTLDGSVTDPDGDTTTCQWTVISKPTNSQASFSDPRTAVTLFIPDIVDTNDASNSNKMTGKYEAKLKCTDSFGDTGEDTVAITATNERPNANPGPDRIILECDRASLGRGSSSDSDGDKLSSQWEMLSQPSNSKAALSSSSSTSPSFFADAEGVYTFKLTVNDGTGAPNAEDTAEVTITAVSNPLCSVKTVVTNVDLLFNELSHELYETLIAINNGRKLLSSGRSVNLVEDSIEDALAQIDLTIAKFAELQGLLGQLHEQLGSTLGKIQSMLEDAELTPAQIANLIKMKLKVESIELFTGELGNELESLQDRVDDGEPGEDPADDLKEVLEAAQEALAGDDLDGTRATLNLAYQLTRTALRENKRLVRKKKQLIMSLVGAEAALRRSAIASQNETVSTLPTLRELGKGFTMSEDAHSSIRFQALAANTKSLRLSVYTINGRLVFDREVPGSQIFFEGATTQGQPLPNGVYLIVLSAQSNDDSRTTNQVQKIVLKR